MSASYPTPWTFEAEDVFEDSPIRAANGEYVLVRDNGVYPPDLVTCREIVAAVNGRAALAAVLRDMEEDCEAAWEGTPLRRALAKYAARLREIAGEGETPTGKGVGE